MDVQVRNQQGNTVETVQLDDAVFDVPMNHSLVHQALVIYQLNKRQGTHDTKTRGQVSGGGRKPWTQKHTGRARQGSIRAPQWRHGGVVFGPHPRDYRKMLPRRMRRLALKCVLSDKVRQNRLLCLDKMDTIDGRTKSMIDLLANLSVSGSALLVTRDTDQQVVRAASNIKNLRTLPVNLLNAQELLSRDLVIITLDAARWAEDTLSVEPHGRAQRSSGSAIAGISVASDGPVEDAPVAAESGPEDTVMTASVEEEPEETAGAAEDTEQLGSDDADSDTDGEERTEE